MNRPASSLLERETFDAGDVWHVPLLLIMKYLGPKQLVQVFRQGHDPIDQAKQLAHIVLGPMAAVQSFDQPELPLLPAGRIAARLQGLQMRQHDVRKWVIARFQCLHFARVIEQLGDPERQFHFTAPVAVAKIVWAPFGAIVAQHCQTNDGLAV